MTAAVLLVKNAAGTLVFDSQAAYAGVCVGFIDVAASSAPVFTYPEYAGFTLIPLGVDGTSSWSVTIDYALGYPRAAFASSVARSFLMFVQ